MSTETHNKQVKILKQFMLSEFPLSPSETSYVCLTVLYKMESDTITIDNAHCFDDKNFIQFDEEAKAQLSKVIKNECKELFEDHFSKYGIKMQELNAPAIFNFTIKCHKIK